MNESTDKKVIGCKWCNDFEEIKGTFWAINPYKKLKAGNTTKFKFCPMCGRKLN